MAKDRSDLRVLLLQIRDEPRVRQEEHDSFSKYCGLGKEQIQILNVFDTPIFSCHEVDGFDALFVGGASEASVLEPVRYPFVKDGQAMLSYCLDKDIPVFASCFGFQLAVVALGGEIVRDKAQFEMGVVSIALTQAAKTDPLYQDIANPFLAISVHQEKATTLPDNCELLAFTQNCCHSFRVKEKPFWAFQFHPEVDKQTLISRLTIFKEKYTESDEHLGEVLVSAVETPASNNLLKSFVDRILL